jgi:glutathione synthase/RimK-type ligase-like ATP-grasp enzyme
MILCLTHSCDFYTIDIVQQHLKELGFPSVRFNMDEFAVNSRFSYTLTDTTKKNNLLIEQFDIDPEKVKAVWYRKGWDLKIPTDLDPAFRHTFIKEYNTYRQIFFNLLSHVPWMNKMDADHAINNDKFFQLSMAEATGLKVPQTVFTNDANAIREFFTTCKGNMVVKLHGSLSRSMEGNSAFFPTTRLSENDLDRLDELAYCPMIFQEYVPKSYELRIAYVDGDFFTGKIGYEETEEATDWRAIKGQALQWQHYELPLTVRRNICALMRKLDLSFGAIDMIRRTDGEYIFLEVNPQGEWGMLQRDLHYPIGETIAQKLIMRINE